MKRFFPAFLLLAFCFPAPYPAQIPTATMVEIVRAEDERRYDQTLENLLAGGDEKLRARAALAAGRIGDERAVEPLVRLLRGDSSPDVRRAAAFALGEIESAQATGAIIEVLNNRETPKEVRARALEAAGKIAAANPKDGQTPLLGETILKTLDYEDKKRESTNREVSLMGLTAVLRARPANADDTLLDFLGYSDARMRADALNTLARLRSKKANPEARELLRIDPDPVVRANAARVLGAAEDKDAFDLLLKAATEDADSRVRVSAVRALAGLKDLRAADALLTRAEKLFQAYSAFKMPPRLFPKEKNELLEIATALSRILPNSNHERATKFLTRLSTWEYHQSPEPEVARARISPAAYLKEFASPDKQKLPLSFSDDDMSLVQKLYFDWRAIGNVSQGLAEIANLDKSVTAKDISAARDTIGGVLLILSDPGFYKSLNERFQNFPEKDSRSMERAIPDVLRAYAAFKADDLPAVLREQLKHRDAIVRATAAELLGDQPATKENVETLKTAFTRSLLTDKHENDAQLAILDALYKLDKKESAGSLLAALRAPDYLVRQKAFQLIKTGDFAKDYPGMPSMVAGAKMTVQPVAAYHGTRLGQILNTRADYVRAVSRKNARAIVKTVKGEFNIEFLPEEAPLTVDNFIRLARSGYFNNVSIHRVVPNFVMQDGDPRGDGNGGPGWQIRCEINQIGYDRGAVGMALSGKDTGGSQWFVTHSPQPHLDGGYTVFGRVNADGMKIVDDLARGDKILSVRIVEGNTPARATRRKPAR